MLHGPCGATNPSCPCMKDGKCSKDYPRQFNKTTRVGEDCYPDYRRRSPEDGGHTTMQMARNLGYEVPMDNRHVVPYNPYLLHKYQAHINVEWCASIRAVKYLYKYVYKGHDKATVTLQHNVDQVAVQINQEENEPLTYENKRYVGACEAVWRILELPIQVRFSKTCYTSMGIAIF